MGNPFVYHEWSCIRYVEWTLKIHTFLQWHVNFGVGCLSLCIHQGGSKFWCSTSMLKSLTMKPQWEVSYSSSDGLCTDLKPPSFEAGAHRHPFTTWFLCKVLVTWCIRTFWPSFWRTQDLGRHVSSMSDSFSLYVVGILLSIFTYIFTYIYMFAAFYDYRTEYVFLLLCHEPLVRSEVSKETSFTLITYFCHFSFECGFEFKPWFGVMSGCWQVSFQQGSQREQYASQS